MLPIPPLSIFLWALAALIGYYFLGGFIWGAGYAPASKSEIANVAALLELKSGKTFYDLGCGYGGFIFAMAQRYNAECIGVEIDPVKCWWIRFMIKQKKLEGRVKLVQSNLLDVNLEDAENVFVFLSKGTDIMKKLRAKMFQEMKPNARVVSYVHRFDDWLPDKTVGELYVYSIPERKPEGAESVSSVQEN